MNLEEWPTDKNAFFAQEHSGSIRKEPMLKEVNWKTFAGKYPDMDPPKNIINKSDTKLYFIEPLNILVFRA